MPAAQQLLRRSRWWAGGDVVLVTAALVLDLLIWGQDGRTRLGFTVPAGVVVATAVCAFPVLLLRRRRPWVAFATMWAYTVVWGSLLPTYQPFTGLLIALYEFARYADARVARQPLPLLIVPWTINTYNAVRASGAHPVATVVTAAVWCAIAATVWLAGRSAHRTQHIFELQTANQAAQAALALQQQQLRLARELHDIVAHSISAVMFQSAGARAAATTMDPQLEGALRAIETSSTQAMRELRRLLGLLHPEEDITSIEAVASLTEVEQLFETTRACAVDVRFSEEGQSVRLDPSVDHTAYRVLQESLSNTMKHGGAGAQAEVHLAWSVDKVRITVRSRPGLGPVRSGANGPNTSGHFSPSGFGLDGLRQRVSGVGGLLDAGPTPDGYLVIAELPL